MEKIKTIFFGTHEFAATILQGLIDSPFINVELVITQPDKPAGRKKELQKPPVKILAEKHNLPIDQPTSLKSSVLSFKPFDLGVVAQYGLLIPKEILEAPKHGLLNVHTSLLPRYRGASPIQSVLINGEAETGVTIMKLDEGLDTGPIILQKALKIAPDDTYPQLEKKLAQIGSEALLEAIPGYVSGESQPVPQDNSQATTCQQLTREDGQIDWQKSATEIYNQYRGMTPWPGVWTVWNDKRLKLLKIKPAQENLEVGQVGVKDDKMYIGCGEDAIEVFELQLEGKQKMTVDIFVNGYKNIDKSLLG